MFVNDLGLNLQGFNFHKTNLVDILYLAYLRHNKLMKNILLIVFLMVFSCASKPGHYQVHRAYVDTVMRAKNTMEKPQLVKWLKEQIKRKESELSAYGSLQNREGRVLENHQQRESELSARRDDINVYEFKRRTTEMKMYRYDKKKNFIKSELLMLRSMLAERE